jgi:nucleotide-binding universal stress UspA family protein
MFKRILVPVDGSDTSNKALVAASQLARDGGGRIRLVHVVENLGYLAGYDIYGGSTAELLKIATETGSTILKDATAIVQASGVEVDNMLYDKFAQRLPEVVADAAKRWNADLVVVGTHGRRGVSRMLLGSGAEGIIRLAPVPVLVIRASEETSINKQENK